MHVIGTAGHVDHGKSTLVRALTGIDPDRLTEEKARGLTIDLGFAWLTLPSGRDASIVDVPGHERFIKNMLAGAGGIDLALLVVAADEGAMPQTREHLAILELLGIERGIVVITKADLVDEETLDLVDADLDDALAGTPFATAPRLRVSGATGAGLPALVEAIDASLETTPERMDRGRPRLAVDRVFTSRGFGTVVTGTLVDGSLAVGQEVAIEPGGRRARIRGLQRHGHKTERLAPGTRAAVNLSGIEKDDVQRGDVVCAPGSVQSVRAVDVRLTAPAILAHDLSHNMGVTFLSGTAETEAKLRLLDAESVAPGQSAWAQVVFEHRLPLREGDRYVVRSPDATLGGGVIVALDPRRHRRNDAATIASLERRLAGSPADRIRDRLDAGPAARAEVEALVPEGAAVLSELVESGEVISSGQSVASRGWLDRQAGRAGDAIAAYLSAYPLRAGAPAEHVRTSAAIDRAAWPMVLEHALASGVFVQAGPSALATPGHEVRLEGETERAAGAYIHALRGGHFAPPTDVDIDQELLAYLVQRGDVVDVGAGVVFERSAYEEARGLVIAKAREQGQITLAEVRDLLGTSRKYVQAFLEHLDAEKVTRRVGDARVLREAEVRT